MLQDGNQFRSGFKKERIRLSRKNLPKMITRIQELSFTAAKTTKTVNLIFMRLG